MADAFALLPRVPDGRNWHVATPLSQSTTNGSRAIPPGGSRRDLPDDLNARRPAVLRGHGDVMVRLAGPSPATTIRTEFHRPEKGRFLHPTEDRPISIREAARLAGASPTRTSSQTISPCPPSLVRSAMPYQSRWRGRSANRSRRSGTSLQPGGLVTESRYEPRERATMYVKQALRSTTESGGSAVAARPPRTTNGSSWVISSSQRVAGRYECDALAIIAEVGPT